MKVSEKLWRTAGVPKGARYNFSDWLLAGSEMDALRWTSRTRRKPLRAPPVS